MIRKQGKISNANANRHARKANKQERNGLPDVPTPIPCKDLMTCDWVVKKTHTNKKGKKKKGKNQRHGKE